MSALPISNEMKKTTNPIVVGNWKMNPQAVAVASRLATEIKKKIARIEGVDIVIAPPAIFLSVVADNRNGKHPFMLGAQNVHSEKLGAYTGGISLPMLESFGVTHVIIGHSERRAEGETDEMVNRKIHAVIKANCTAIVCVGERERDHAAHYLNTIESQIRIACAGISKSKLERLVIAYEPIWAIGTGNTATPEDAHEMKIFIEKTLSDLYGRSYAQKVRIIYGGSVTGKNAYSLMTEGMVDGFLVGGASLHADDFTEIIQMARI